LRILTGWDTARPPPQKVLLPTLAVNYGGADMKIDSENQKKADVAAATRALPPVPSRLSCRRSTLNHNRRNYHRLQCRNQIFHICHLRRSAPALVIAVSMGYQDFEALRVFRLSAPVAPAVFVRLFTYGLKPRHAFIMANRTAARWSK
jgi:hypothetical protein